MFIIIIIFFIIVLEKAEGEAGVVEAKVNEISKKIMDASGNRVKAARKKRDEVSKKLDNVNSEKSKLEVGIKTAER